MIMVNLGSDEIIKYPFLDEAGKYLSDKGFSLEDFATNADLKKIVESAFERITTAIDGRIYKSDLATNNSSTTKGLLDYDREVSESIMSAIDKINSRYGSSTLKIASEGIEKVWKMKRENVSQSYTTRFDELVVVNS